VLFAFYASQSQGITQSNLVAKDNTSKFLCNVATNIGGGWDSVNVNFNFGNANITGKWALINSDNTFNTNDNFANTLNSSQYGPCNMH